MLAHGDDGKWRTGLDVCDSATGSVVGPAILSPSFETREQALLHVVEVARGWFSKPLAREDVWMRNRVHAEAKAILKQIDEAYPPRGAQMNLF
jgi:hypothetical protein